MPTNRARTRAGASRPVLATIVLALVAGLLAACSKDAGVEARARSRQAQANDQDGGWDLVMHVILKNQSLQPVEVGAFANPEEAANTIVSASPAKAHDAFTNLITVPAATGGGAVAGRVDLLLKAKATDSYGRISKPLASFPTDPYEGQHLWIATPTMQFRIKTVYEWKREPNCSVTTVCQFERRTQVQVTTLDRNGDPAAPKQIMSCLDPISLPGWSQQVGSLDEPSSARYAAPRKLSSVDDGPYLDGFDITFRNASDIGAAECASQTYNPGYVLPGASLAMSMDPDSDPGTGIQLPKLRLASTTMPGVDFSWANLASANFSSDTHSNLSYASFDHANLTDAKFMGANLTGASFDGAVVDGLNLEGATLYGVDLTKSTGRLGSTEDIHMCRSKLPEYLQKELGTAYQPESGCAETLWTGAGAQPGYDGLLVDTGGRAPLVLSGAGKPGCRAQSAAGANQGLRLPDCNITYASAQLPQEHGAFLWGKGTIQTGVGNLDLRLTNLYGWTGGVCLKTMSTATSCPDSYGERHPA